MEQREKNDLIYYQFEQLAGVTHGVFTRCGGVSDAPYGPLNLGRTVGDVPTSVDENYRRVYAALYVDAEQVCSVWQVHSGTVIVPTGPVPGRSWIAKADGMVTNVPGRPLVMRFADCTPILLFDPVQRAVGVAHAGWRGTVQGVGANTLQRMATEYGSRPADVRVGIGPSIGPGCYQVGEEVVAAAEAYFGDVSELIRRDPDDGSAYFDLWAANALDMRRNGVPDEQIEIAGICTMTNTHEFHSHRGEHGQTGRFAAVISL